MLTCFPPHQEENFYNLLYISAILNHELNEDRDSYLFPVLPSLWGLEQCLTHTKSLNEWVNKWGNWSPGGLVISPQLKNWQLVPVKARTHFRTSVLSRWRPTQARMESTPPLFEGVCPRFPFSLTSCKIIIIPWNKLSQRPCWDFPVVSNVVNPNKPDRKGAAALWIKKQIKSFLSFKLQLAIPQSKGVLDKPKWPLPVLHQVFSPPRKLSLISSQRATGK